MKNDSDTFDILILAAPDAWSHKRVWGTGGWLPPEEREALDWLVLARMTGLQTRVLQLTDPDCTAAVARTGRTVIVAGTREDLPTTVTAAIAALLQRKPAIAVFRHRRAEDQGADGTDAGPQTSQRRELTWRGPGEHRTWSISAAWLPPELTADLSWQAWAELDGRPLVLAHREGCGWIVELGFHPSRARDSAPEVTQLLQHLLVWGPDQGVSWIDLSNTLVLRMDDPGGAQNIHNRHWRHRELDAATWSEIGRILNRHNATLSVGYVGGWVDDGDRERGTLFVAGQIPERLPGRVHSTPEVRYIARCARGRDEENDYEGECRELRRLANESLLSIELHGFTHMHPNAAAWARAEDRYDRVGWFRELGQEAQSSADCIEPAAHPINQGFASLISYFGSPPCTLIPPGDEWTEDALGLAIDQDLSLVSSYYLAIRHGDRLCWSTHICAPYLDRPGSAWFESGLPVIGYFHDRDIALYGAGWLDRYLDQWRQAGAENIIDFRRLNCLLSHQRTPDGIEEHQDSEPADLSRFRRRRADRT